jgi:hypothetical protein
VKGLQDSAGLSHFLMRRCVLFSAAAALILLTITRDGRAANISFVSPRIGIASGQGFCTDGAYPRTSWPEPRPGGIHTWGFYCAAGDRGQGAIVTSPFVASGSLRLYLAGYTSNAGLSLAIERISDHSQFLIQPSREPHEQWRLYDFSLPGSWSGSLVRLMARDQNTGPGGWIAFSEPVTVREAGTRHAIMLAAETIGHFVLLLLPALAVCAWVVRKGVRNAVTAGLVLLACLGAFGYLVFWCYFIQPRFGYWVAFGLPVSAVAFIVAIAWKFDSRARQVFKPLIAPVALTGLAALLVLSLGFIYGGLQDPFDTAQIRFLNRLPADNVLPYYVATGLRQGHVPKPLFMDWLTSDRPPLQSGIVLSQEPFGHPRKIGYTVISVVAQSLWILGLWLLLTAFGTKRRLIALILLTCLFSGFVFLNSFFVWPKLLAAAFTLGFFAVLFGRATVLASFERRLQWVASGVLLALGVLSHGGTAFALIGAAFAFVALRRRLPLASIALMAGIAGAVYLPWMLFQKFVDPPGNRLLKMHLAGVDAADNRSFGEALTSAYRDLTLHQIVDHKVANARTVIGAGLEWDYWRGVTRTIRDLLKGDYGEALKLAADHRAGMFFFFVPSLGFLPYAIFALLAGVKRRFRTSEWHCAATLAVITGFSLLDWCLLMFGPGTTYVHQGAYALNLLAMAACILALRPVSRWLAVVVSSLQVTLNVLLYVVLMRGFVPGGPLPEGHVHRGMLVLSLLALAASVYCLIVMANDGAGPSRAVEEVPDRIVATKA